MNHETRPHRSQKSGIAAAMVVLCQRPLTKYLHNMHGRHPVLAIGEHSFFCVLVELSLAALTITIVNRNSFRRHCCRK